MSAACATGTVLSFQCQQCGGCSPTLTLLPGRPTTQMLLLATTPLSSWPFGASQVDHGNVCHSYPKSELSNNSWPTLGSHCCLSRDKSLFCFSENFHGLLDGNKEQFIGSLTWQAGLGTVWAVTGSPQEQQFSALSILWRDRDNPGLVYDKDSVCESALQQESPQLHPFSSVQWRGVCVIFVKIPGLWACTPNQKKVLCQSAAYHLLLTQIPVLAKPLPSATCTFHTVELPLRGPRSRSLAGRAGIFNPVESQPSVIPYPAMLGAVSLPAAGPTLFLYEKPKSNLMSFLRLIFSKDRQSQETHPWYLLR